MPEDGTRSVRDLMEDGCEIGGDIIFQRELKPCPDLSLFKE
jgi:hypothetical protein